MGNICIDKLLIQGAPLEGENPLPFFRNPEHDLKVSVRDEFPEKYKNLLGHETGFRLLPYTRQDRYSHQKRELTLKTIILENNNLRAVFLPEYGARLISLVNKADGKELLYRNPVFQPANLAIRNAWFSGGIEWNIGHYGHAFSTCEPVFFSSQIDDAGEQFLRIWEYERCKGLFWSIDFHLDTNSPLLLSHVSVHNPDPIQKSMYYWTNIAIRQSNDSRVFSQGPDVIWIDPWPEKGTKRFGWGQLPNLELQPDVDSSYPARSSFANEYFFACDSAKRPWEVALRHDGQGFFEASTSKLAYRKMFCWGNQRGGQNWSEFLSCEDEMYFEIQAGLAPTQLHGIIMPAKSTWNWTQVFGPITVTPESARDPDWNRAQRIVSAQVDQLIPEESLQRLDERACKSAAIPPKTILHLGSGWGALEVARRRKCGQEEISASMLFPDESLCDLQESWLNLLNAGKLLLRNPQEGPGTYMVQLEWEELLEDSIDNGKEDWLSHLHLGIMAMERGDVLKACTHWNKSLAFNESAWAFRNLAYVKKMQGFPKEAILLYQKALDSPGYTKDRAIAEEYFELMIEEGLFEAAEKYYQQLEPTWKNESDLLAFLYGNLCIKTGKIGEVKKILTRNFANIREGENPLSDLWHGIEGNANSTLPSKFDFTLS